MWLDGRVVFVVVVDVLSRKVWWLRFIVFFLVFFNLIIRRCRIMFVGFMLVVMFY